MIPKDMADDPKVLMVLAYFKTHNDYSFQEISEYLGLSLLDVDDIISYLMDFGFLRYENDLIRLTLKGRVMLQNKDIDHYSFEIDDNRHASSLHTNEVVYLPDTFMGIKKR